MTIDTRARIAAAALAGLLAACGSESSSDCDEANPPAATQTFGQSCFGFYYGSCPTLFHDCVSGVCSDTKTSSSICTTLCSGDGQCPAGWYCRPGSEGSVCTRPATCSTFCDGVCCCEYARDPLDPTECRQGACSCSP